MVLRKRVRNGGLREISGDMGLYSGDPLGSCSESRVRIVVVELPDRSPNPTETFSLVKLRILDLCAQILNISSYCFRVVVFIYTLRPATPLRVYTKDVGLGCGVETECRGGCLNKRRVFFNRAS